MARGAELAATMGPNPTLCASLREEGQLEAAGLAEYALKIKAYRPAATVFEAEIANSAKGKGLLAMAARNSSAMQQKRAAHDKHIIKAKETGHGIVARRRKVGRPDEEEDRDEGSSDDDDEYCGGGDSDDDDEMDPVEPSQGKGKKVKGGKVKRDTDAGATDAFHTGKFRDNEFFLDVTPRGVNHTELGLSTMEDAMGRPIHDHQTLEGALQQATMDIVEEDSKGMNRQHRVSVWDKKKRNYVRVNASEVDRVKNKRIKTESGAVVKKDDKAVGEMYKKWQQKTHKSINATGSVEDPMSSAGGKARGIGRFKYRHHKSADDPGPGSGPRGGRGSGGGDDTPNELKSKDQIRKERLEAKKKKGRGSGGGRGGGGDRGGGRFGSSSGGRGRGRGGRGGGGRGRR